VRARKALAVRELVKASAAIKAARDHVADLNDENLNKRLYELAVHCGIEICNVNKRSDERVELS
jgi:hypothetical protein